MPTNKKYGVILADPPWQYRSKNGNGTAQNHYDTMTTNDLMELPIYDQALPDSVLLMWVTFPMVPDAMQIITAWGYEYVTGFPWIKLQDNPRIDLFGEAEIVPAYGTGFWVRGCAELVFIARRGKPALPNGDFLGLISKRMKHSRKPDNIHHYAESLQGPYLELFARRPRDGWDVFGNEVEGSIEL